MALPQVNENISPLEFYPDKVTINLQFSVSLSWTNLDKGLRYMGFRKSDGLWTYDLILHDERGYSLHPAPNPRRFSLRVNRPRIGAPLSFFIDINPLRQLHLEAGGDPHEISSIANSKNWLPASVVGRDCRAVWQECDFYIVRAREFIIALITQIQELAGKGHLPPPVCEHISAHTVECAIDLRTANPRQQVTDFMPAFSALLRDNEQREYRAVHVIRPEADLMIHGFVNQATRLKMYCRTNRRIRFEVRLRPDTFAHYRIARAISAETQTFVTLFERCATISRDLFLDLRSRAKTSLNIHSSRTPLDLIIALMATTRRPVIMREVLECLLRTGKIQNSLYDGKLIAALKGRGILTASNVHGFSCFSREYGSAAALLANAQDDYFIRTLRRPSTDFDQGRHQARRNRRPVSYR